MEFVVPIIGALVKSTLPTLLSAIGKKEWPEVEASAKRIQSDFKLIQATINDITSTSGGRGMNHLPRACLEELTSLAYDIEDSITFHVANKTRKEIAQAIGELEDRSKRTREQIKDYTEMAKSGGASTTKTNKEVPLADHGPMDIKDARKTLFNLIERQSEGKRRVISVVPSGGLGNTPPSTLAKQVYESHDNGRFSPRAWVDASGKHATDVLTEILEQVQKKPLPGPCQRFLSWVCSLYIFKWLLLICQRVLPWGSQSRVLSKPIHGASTSYVKQFKSCLGKKRYLIAIDNAKTEELDDIMSAFSEIDGVGGRIIVTTTIQSAATCCMCGVGDLPLPEDSSSEFVIVESEAEELCRTLAERVHGVHVSHYESLCSLVHQQCLTYFCMFPRDHPVRRNPLTRIWLAEGLVDAEAQAEEVGNNPPYVALFKTLIDRDIIHRVRMSNDGEVKGWQPREGMLDYISRKSRSQNFVSLFCREDAQRCRSPVRRLSLHPANGRLDLPKEEYLSRLRTLAVFPTSTADLVDYGGIFKSPKKHELLRVLDLKQCAHLNKKHLKAICHLLLLKYLSFGGSVDELPKQIGKLKFLETLDLRRSKIVTVHLQVIQLPRLKHLLGMFRLSKVSPKELQSLLSPKCSLETISGFVTGQSQGQGFLQLMTHLKLLMKVKIWLDSTAADSASSNHLSEAIKIFIRQGNGTTAPKKERSLSINFQQCPQPSFLQSLQAPGGLTSLKLCGKLSEFPQFVAGLNTIQELCLSWTGLTGAAILAGLSKLNLRYLKLIEDDLGPLVIGPKHFPGLKRICLVGQERLHGITIQAGALKFLVSLHILCQALDILPAGPSGIDIKRLASLKEVALHSKVAPGIKRKWEEGATDHDNKPIVLSIDPPMSRDQDLPLIGTNGTAAKMSSYIKGLFASARPGS